MKRLAFLSLLVGIVAMPLFAQIPTGTLAGHVTEGQQPLPGVTVTATSPSLQGARTATTSVNGDYIFTFLPPGDYKVRFELQGFQTIDTSVKINAAQTQRVDATMPQAKVAEEVTVTGSYETISTSGTSATTYEKSLINKLPVLKDINTAALLTAGVVANAGAQGAVTIAGAPSFENLFLVNGVAIMDNVRGTPTAGLYIEEAVQETTTTVSDVSAEYGRFTGGVVTMLTKSGGNDFHASYRDTLTNDKWTATTPKTTAQRLDHINNNHEGTLGGFLVKDHLWFFLAGRKQDLSLSAQTYYTNVPYSTGSTDKRYEGKLTFSINPNHRLVGSYDKNEHSDFGYGFIVTGYNVMDLASVYTRQTPRDLMAFNYTGVLTDNFFVEGQYSKKTFTFENSGSRFTDMARGTPIDDYVDFGGLGFYNSPIFCGVCTAGAEKRDNRDYLGKASWFLSSQNLGTHDVVLGIDQFEDMRTSNNYQSGSSWFMYVEGSVFKDATHLLLDSNGTPYPVLSAASGASVLFWAPIFQLSQGNNFKTQSAFLNDKWRLNNNWSFNIGVRYDKNHGINASGFETAKDSKVSPRVGVTFDPKGDGDWQFNASYAKYVAGIANTQADASAAGGQPASLSYLYADPASMNPALPSSTPPDINTNCDPTTLANCLTSPQAITTAFAWYNALSQAQKNALIVFATVPGVNLLIPAAGLASPNTDEYTLGFSKRLGNSGLIRLDYVNRKYNDSYIAYTTGTTVTDQFGTVYDLSYETNSNILKREYRGIHVSGSYRLSDSLNIGGNYTWSTLKGNWNSENGGSGPISSAQLQYPEYKAYPQYNPEGYLTADQRNRARIFAVWDVFNTKHNRVSLSLLQSYLSGTPYGAVGTLRMSTSYVPSSTPAYVSPPLTSGASYYFTSRDAYRWDSQTSTDLGVTYAFVLPALGTDLQFYLEPRVTNVFNEHAVIGGNTTILTRNSGSSLGLTSFNPFTTAPVECPQGASASTCSGMNANWQKGTNFGKPISPANYQDPRRIVVSLGVRF